MSSCTLNLNVHDCYISAGIVENSANKTCEELSFTTRDYIKILWAAAAELPGEIWLDY